MPAYLQRPGGSATPWHDREPTQQSASPAAVWVAVVWELASVDGAWAQATVLARLFANKTGWHRRPRTRQERTVGPLHVAVDFSTEFKIKHERRRGIFVVNCDRKSPAKDHRKKLRCTLHGNDVAARHKKIFVNEIIIVPVAMRASHKRFVAAQQFVAGRNDVKPTSTRSNAPVDVNGRPVVRRHPQKELVGRTQLSNANKDFGADQHACGLGNCARRDQINCSWREEPAALRVVL